MCSSRVSARSVRGGCELREDRGIKLVLLLLNAGVQKFRCIAGKDRHAALRDDFTRVHARIDVVNGAATFLGVPSNGLLPRFEAGKGG